MRPLRNGAMVSGSYSRKYMIPPMHMQKRPTCNFCNVSFTESARHELCLIFGTAVPKRLREIKQGKNIQRENVTTSCSISSTDSRYYITTNCRSCTAAHTNSRGLFPFFEKKNERDFESICGYRVCSVSSPYFSNFDKIWPPLGVDTNTWCGLCSVFS